MRCKEIARHMQGSRLQKEIFARKARENAEAAPSGNAAISWQLRLSR
jgi:hypothetical protein